MQTFAPLRLHVLESTTVSRTTNAMVRIMHKARVVVVGDNHDDATLKKKNMVMYYPNNVFEAFNVREQALFESSRLLLASFRAIVEGWQDATREACTDFVELLNAYIAPFRARETPDKERLTNRLKDAIRALMHQRLLVPLEDVEPLVRFAAQIQTLFDKYTLTLTRCFFLLAFCRAILCFGFFCCCCDLAAFCAGNRPRSPRFSWKWRRR
jgi:hypothetical protein